MRKYHSNLARVSRARGYNNDEPRAIVACASTHEEEIVVRVDVARGRLADIRTSQNVRNGIFIAGLYCLNFRENPMQ